ncbi:MAG: metal-dependent phosphohydrolase [Planctomycetota bacterium]
MVVACLLHAIGHLLHDDARKAYQDGVDDTHEDLGGAWLRDRFPAVIVEPVAMHAASKRYLCATEPRYWAALSDGSQRTLKAQGGPMPADECAAVESRPHFERAVELRRCDDLGKDPEDHRESIDDYRETLTRVLEAFVKA